MRIALWNRTFFLILAMALGHPTSFANDKDIGTLFDIGTDARKPARSGTAPAGSRVGDLFGISPAGQSADKGKTGKRDVVGDALTEHDTLLLTQATRKLDDANLRMRKHCGCVLDDSASCTTPWQAQQWERSSSFLRSEKGYQQTLTQVCRNWHSRSSTLARDTIDDAKASAQKIELLASELDTNLAQASSAASLDRRRYEDEQREAREREERRQAKAREREREREREARREAMEREHERTERRHAQSSSSSFASSLYGALTKQNQHQDAINETFRKNNEMWANAARAQAERRNQERAQEQKRRQDEAQRLAERQRLQQRTYADASRTRQHQRAEQEQRERREAERREAQRKAEQDRQREMEARRQAEQERQRQMEAKRQAREAAQRQREAERQAAKAAEERARQNYLHTMANSIRAKAISCFGEMHVVTSRPKIRPEAVSCIDVHWRAYCPGTIGVSDVSHNVVGMGTGCFGDSTEIKPKPACPADQVRVEIRDVRACP